MHTEVLAKFIAVEYEIYHSNAHVVPPGRAATSQPASQPAIQRFSQPARNDGHARAYTASRPGSQAGSLAPTRNAAQQATTMR